MSKADEDINNQVGDLPTKRRKTREVKESEVAVGSTGGGLARMAVKSNFDPIIKRNGNFTDKDKTIEFLESRGFVMEQTDDNFEMSYSPFYWSGAKRNICRIRRIRSNKTIGQSHEDYLQRGSLNTENTAIAIMT
jgi:hypothetical protein